MILRKKEINNILKSPVKTIADVAPIAPKNELYAGHLSVGMFETIFIFEL